MRKTISTFVFAAAASALQVQPADARTQYGWGCVIDSVASCNRDFSGSDSYTVAIRGWCYLIRSAIC